MKDFTEKSGRIKYQFNTCQQAMKSVLQGLFSPHLVPPDRTLADFYRSHKNCGSRDRAFLNLCIYSVLRRWGWLRILMPETERENVESGRTDLALRDIAAMTGFSLICDGADENIIREVLDIAGERNFPRAAGEPLERAQKASQIFGKSVEFSYDMLAPDFRHLVPENWDYSAYMQRLALRPALWIRFASPKGRDLTVAELREKGITFEEYNSHAAAIPGSGVNLSGLTSFQNGAFEVQDLASQCVGLVCSPTAGERWYDACAGAGGKTLHLASLMSGKGSIVSGDIRANALESLKKRARRAGWSNITTRPHDGARWKGKHQFDGVLVDAPCSGSGVWRRNAALQWRLTEEEIKQFADRQLAILENNACAVKSGGVLVYATCSIFECENEGVAQKFLERNPDFYAEEFNHPLTGNPCRGAMRAGCGKADCDELFAFKMRRK